MVGSVQSANKYISDFGLTFRDEEYGSEVIITDLADHPITSGVHQLRILRPSPVMSLGNRTQILARPSNARPNEGVLGIYEGEKGRILALGNSLLWYSFLDYGKNYDNPKVFLNSFSHATQTGAPLDTFFWLFGAIIAVCAMGFATRAGKSTRTLRRILMVAIIFGLSFTIYYPIAKSPVYARDSLQNAFYLEVAIVFLVTFLFSAMEKGLSWSFIFGNSLTWGLVFGYNFFFGYPYWLMILGLIGEGLFFGFLYAFLGAIGQGFIGWVQFVFPGLV